MCKNACFFKDSKWTQGCELVQAGHSSCTVLIIYSNPGGASKSKNAPLFTKGHHSGQLGMFDLTGFLNVGWPLWGKPEIIWISSLDRTDNL